MPSPHLLAFLCASAYLLQDVQAMSNWIHLLSRQSYFPNGASTYNGRNSVNSYTTKSGLTINIVDAPGPMVKSYFCIATKTEDDFGEPHVLEHLLFYGTALHLLASKCFSDATNGGPSVDRTCFTSAHVGKDGLLTLLPVFVDHILHPHFLASSLITEVHHIKEDGSDGGVVYNELLGMPYDINYHAMLRTLYGNYGYASQPLGKLETIQNMTLQMIVDFHNKYYRPENLCITIFGDVTIDEVMNSIQITEQNFPSKSIFNKWKRPWLASMPALKTKTVKTLIPSEDEGFAEVYIAWRGPNCATEYPKLVACNTLMAHLALIANESDFSAGTIESKIMENSKSALSFVFKNVTVGDVDAVYPKFNKWLQDIATGKTELNRKRMNKAIKSQISSLSNSLDVTPIAEIAQKTTNYFLYGKSEKDLKNMLNTENVLKSLLTVPDSYFTDLLREYFADEPYAQSIGIDSKSENDRLEKENEERVPNRVKQLGPEELKKKADELAAAVKFNTRPIAESLLNVIAAPSIKNAKFHDIVSYNTNGSNSGKSIGLEINSWPLYANAFDLRTDYVYIFLTLDTNKISEKDRPYLYLLLKAIDAAPFDDNAEHSVGEFHPIDECFDIGLLDADDFSCGEFSQTALFSVKASRDDYEIAAEYMIAKLRHTEFKVENVTTTVEEILENLEVDDDDDEGDDTDGACEDLLRTFYYRSNTNVKYTSPFYQNLFLKSLLTKLADKRESKKIINKLNNLRAELVSREKAALHVATDFVYQFKHKTNVNKVWKGFDFKSGQKKLNVVNDWQLMVPVKCIKVQGEIVGLNDTDTVDLKMFSPGLNGYIHEDYAALTVALKYCSQVDGPLYKRVRSVPYTNEIALELLPSEGVIKLTLSQATDVVGAFGETKKVVDELSEPNAIWSPALLTAAKNGAFAEIISGSADVSDAVYTSMLSSFRKLPTNFEKELYARIRAVTFSDLRRVGTKYLKNIFSTTNSKITIVCSKENADDISKALQEFGFKLPVVDSWETSSLGKVTL